MKGAPDILKDKVFGTLIRGAAIVAAVFLAYVVVNAIVKGIRRKSGRKTPVNDQELSQDFSFYSDLAKRIRNAFKDSWEDFGVTFTEKVQALKALNALNDEEFKEVYNRYNELIDGSRTLRNDIAKEWFGAFQTIDNEVLYRMDDLGLI